MEILLGLGRIICMGPCYVDPKRPKLTTTVKKGILLNTKQDTDGLGPMYTVRQCLLLQNLRYNKKMKQKTM